MATRKKKASSSGRRATTTKPSGLSVHIGLNGVDPAHYAGWSGPLKACEADASDMAKIAKSKGMQSTVLLTRDGNRAKVLAAIRAAAKQLKSGDLFLLTYSGHGGQVPDITGEEDDKKDETWCLYDGELIDDELYLELSGFGAGVRILVFSDSCHSGTVTRARPSSEPSGEEARSKMMPPDVADATYRAHQAFYDNLQKSVAKAAGKGKLADPDTMLAHVATNPRLTRIVKSFKPTVLLISGCQDNQTSMDGAHNGAFTEQLLHVWNSGAYKGDYVRFHAQIKAGLPSSQTPNLFTLGTATKFLKEQPFTV
ncbi:MAG TPA: caspase family protein [Burkholderiales bacterium]|nr:caspase family protein [Burkholderiales bacterium]